VIDPGAPRYRADVVVLGAGPGGERVASDLARAGCSVIVVERRLVGGACPYVSCIPTKSMLVSAARGLPWAEAVARRDRHAAYRNDAVAAAQLIATGVQLLRGAGRVLRPGLLEVRSGRRASIVAYTDLVVATGSASGRPDIPGLADVPTWVSAEAMSSDIRPDSLAILGGGAAGCELAQLYARFGSQVTLVEPASRLLPEEPPFVGELVADALVADGVDVRTATTIVRVEPTEKGADAHLAAGPPVGVERVVVATGRVPRTAALGLDQLGVELDDGDRLRIDDRCAVAEHLWAIGDATDVLRYRHTATQQALVVASALLGGDLQLRPAALPRTVMTDPAVFGVGVRPGPGVRVEVASADLRGTARGYLDRRGGRVELYADPGTATLVGGIGVGPRADEWMGQVLLAVTASVPLPVLAGTVQAFPSYAEALYPAVVELLRRCAGSRGMPEPRDAGAAG